MNRVCLTKDGRLIEMQSGGDDRPELMEMRLDTLRQNALNSGYKEEEIEVKWVTDAEYLAAKAEDPNEIAAQAERTARAAEQAAKAQAIIDNLPSWAQVKAVINNAFPLQNQNIIITKLARAVYWDVKGTAD